MRSTIIAAVFVCLFSALSTAAQRVDEKASEVIFRGNEAIVRLAVIGDTPQRNVAARVSLIDPNGLERSAANITSASIGTSRQMLEFRLPLGDLSVAQNEDLAWYRLTYRVGDTVGVAAVSQLARELFELRILAASNVMTGMGYRVRVRALNPFTEAPSAGVAIDAVLELDAREGDGPAHIYRGSGVTDRDGFAAIDLDIPVEAVLDGDGEITVTGSRNGLRREANDDLAAVHSDLDFLMMTDKPIYQPEQMLNIRGIIFKGSAAKTVLANEEIEFRIEDEDDTLLFREKVRSSGFGVAAIAWRIPTNAKLGDYTISVRDSRGESIGRNTVKVSRYDLPNFVVNTKTTKPYYLPADRFAEVEVRADYLFGKPVTKGKVRVVQETSREWNWKEQKYDIDEGQVREGELDRSGKFTARLDLSEAHDDLKDDDYDRFTDLRFAAYLTDPTTNKTEQRRFDVRVTREPIHVYLVNRLYDQHPEMPFTTYISTFYADGSPAECDVEIKASEDDEEKYKTIGRIRTNSFGAGKFVATRPAIGEPDDDLDIRILARDSAGRRGTHEVEDLSFDSDENVIQITTDRAIYRSGEPVTVDVLSTVKSGMVYVDVVNNWSVIESLFVRLENGRATLSIPYRESFKGELTIAAFTEDPEDDDDLIVATRGVIFPAMQGIAVETTFDKAIYKPNEEGTVRFGVIDAVGQAIESALGIVILDKAVEERARTDAEFGSMFRGLGGWLGYGKSFGSTNVKDLNDLDLTKPISDELQLVGEIILHDAYYDPNLFHSKRYHNQGYAMYATVISAQLGPLHIALTDAYRERDFLHPEDAASLRQILGLYNVDLDELRDPWGMPYRTEFDIERAERKTLLWSSGPDKTADTKDDFIVLNRSFPYFVPTVNKLNDAVRDHNARTGDFIRDEKTLLKEAGIPELVDAFGRPYRISFTPENRWLTIEMRSVGKNGKYEEQTWRGDDFVVWTSRQDVFAPIETRIRESQTGLAKVAASETELRTQLRSAGIKNEMLRDAAGNPLYINAQRTSRFWNRTRVETVQVYGETTRTDKTVITPVTQEIMQFTFRSPGRDGKPGTYDDVTMMQLVHVISERSKDEKEPVQINKIAYKRNSGAIAGTVTDASGAAIPGATVTATSGSGLTRSTTTSDDGSYLLSSLPAGSYTLQIDAAAFQRWVMNAVPVQANATVRIDASLEVGSVSAVVEVTASGEATVNATNASVVTSQQISALPLMTRNPAALLQLQPGTAAGKDTSTPRLREYFPETLLWQPEVITGIDGKAEVKFRMADNITTWKMYTIASTKNGKVGFAEKEVTAFQSFFVDLDPPKFLTDGDEIFLPTQVRNYTPNRQRVNVTMSPADWYSFISGGNRQVDVASGQSENAIFGFKAVMPINDGKQRVTAIAQDESDAIEKPVTVRPDGREIVATDSRFFNGSTKFDVNFPANALPGTHAAELKIYPNLMAHVAESVEGLLKRPYGCGEQTVSSTYPNLMIIKFAGADEGRIPPDTLRQARKNLRDGYDRLIGYQVANGGFAYWSGRDEADLALTSYALRFLADAASHIAVDPAVIAKAETWLLSQQRADGTWNRQYSWETADNTARALSLTTYIARTLAMLKSDEATARNAALTKALGYLRLKNSQIDDPYSLALLGLALHDSGNSELAAKIANKLVTLGMDEVSGTYWNLESNTVFNGWGSAGRIETTALVTQLLLKVGAEEHKPAAAKGMIFLLRSKDSYGVWYSTQTTINVLDTFIASLAASVASGRQNVDVIVNGETVRTIEIGPETIEQILVPITDRLTVAGNTIELRATGGGPVMAQAVSRHYIGWQDADSTGRNVNASRAVELDYKCDRYQAAIMQEVSCTVRAERVGFRGYGMLLAEIGTPPGADVSRESLEKALESADGISKYEILPDRVIVYMWARPGGTTINFKFRPRYGINAQTPASVVYDYYNPEAQAVAAPMRFAVR